LSDPSIPTVAQAEAITEPHAKLFANIRVQAHGCRHNGSPFYGDLFDQMALDVGHRGPWWELLAPYAHESFGTVRPLRVVGALH
jgi:hypothetical protein